ncbi:MULTISPECIES: NAD-dependent epimerase [Pseudomonas]|uniref:Putative LPS biosynthesis related UDP-glucuronic acid epimerase n=1 Tax=Pseudomonas fluorescens (strain Pf0-1) TaxID=205922 RepID=Q3K8U6_PSEPF|nr:MULTISPECIES: NAD-dependent epimerase [Pseudomonas]ABA75808.1 putative LPS biosynthesis related UDP-glucuronic acid epimerase [Pseudomonas fluorescens Pf0-1]MBL0793608.1 NAD-dependent epimerase [Pseudomonas sp. B7]MBX8625618.1 NAD-dependent epimerase [Pseudomonas glycinae]MBY9025388.1 NAD-dependent epimerase [Pseudomonas fluorescens]MBY9031758.1 NAD-dependent epimerase [Pseudomonas fluorescens]
MKILVTGAAGFIGFHVSQALLARGDEVVGIDNLNDYYEVALKDARLAQLTPQEGFRFIRMDIGDRTAMAELFETEGFEKVVHLAAQAGVRYSLENPHAYADSNLTGFLNVLEGCRQTHVKHLVYASSSSVYGANESMPFAVQDNVDHPVSLYAATKKANELMAHSYSHLYRLPTTGLRFFTVYGPWGRPDMSPFLFVRAILEGKPLKVFNYGKHRRDFTYIDDIVDGVIRVLDHVAAPNAQWSGLKPDPASSAAPWRLYNIGNSQPVELLDYIKHIEQALGKTTHKELLPLQPGDVEHTYADVEQLKIDTGYAPDTPIESGIQRFVNWYKDFYNIS